MYTKRKVVNYLGERSSLKTLLSALGEESQFLLSCSIILLYYHIRRRWLRFLKKEVTIMV